MVTWSQQSDGHWLGAVRTRTEIYDLRVTGLWWLTIKRSAAHTYTYAFHPVSDKRFRRILAGEASRINTHTNEREMWKPHTTIRLNVPVHKINKYNDDDYYLNPNASEIIELTVLYRLTDGHSAESQRPMRTGLMKRVTTQLLCNMTVDHNGWNVHAENSNAWVAVYRCERRRQKEKKKKRNIFSSWHCVAVAMSLCILVNIFVSFFFLFLFYLFIALFWKWPHQAIFIILYRM